MARFLCDFISYSLRRAINVRVIIPSLSYMDCLGLDGKEPKHVPAGHYPVLYLLHGIGNNCSSWSAYSNIERYAEEQKIAVVMMETENKAYCNVEEDCFYDFLNKELPEFLEANFQLATGKENTYLAGLSMGGYGALLHGLKNPEKYAAIGAFSGAVEGIKEYQKDDIRNAIEEDLKKGVQLPAIYLACGEDDFLYKKNQALVKFLEEKKIDFTWVSEPGYSHEWRFWDRQAECFLEWLPRTDEAKMTKVRKM